MMHSISSISTQHLSKTDKKNEDVEKATLELSKMFIRSIFKAMFNEDEKSSSVFGDSHAADNWKYLFLNIVSEECAGHTGIEDTIRQSVAKKSNAYDGLAKARGGSHVFATA